MGSRICDVLDPHCFTNSSAICSSSVELDWSNTSQSFKWTVGIINGEWGIKGCEYYNSPSGNSLKLQCAITCYIGMISIFIGGPYKVISLSVLMQHLLS